MAASSSSPTSTTMIRNILTGVITTVAGAAAVYFLGFHKRGESRSADHLVIKEATTKAWKSYVAVENLEYKNSMLLLQNIQNIDNFKDELTKESNKFSTDVKAILSEDDVDPTFISLLKRRLTAEEEAMQKWNVFFANAETIIQNTPQGQQQTQKITDELTKMQNSGKIIFERIKMEITELAKSLTEKYGYTFAANELLMLQEQQTTANNNNNANQNNIGGGVNVTELNNQGNNNQTNNNSNNNNYNNQNNNNNAYDNYDYGNTTSFSAKSFVGEWQTNAGYMYLDGNGGMSWDWSNGQITDGTWKFYNNQLYQYPTQYYGAGSVWVFNVSNVTSNSFTLQLVNSNVYYYATRVNDGY